MLFSLLPWSRNRLRTHSLVEKLGSISKLERWSFWRRNARNTTLKRLQLYKSGFEPNKARPDSEEFVGLSFLLKRILVLVWNEAGSYKRKRPPFQFKLGCGVQRHPEYIKHCDVTSLQLQFKVDGEGGQRSRNGSECGRLSVCFNKQFEIDTIERTSRRNSWFVSRKHVWIRSCWNSRQLWPTKELLYPRLELLAK